MTQLDSHHKRTPGVQGRKNSGFLQVAVGLYRYQSIDFPNKQSAEKIVDNINFGQI